MAGLWASDGSRKLTADRRRGVPYQSEEFRFLLGGDAMLVGCGELKAPARRTAAPYRGRMVRMIQTRSQTV